MNREQIARRKPSGGRPRLSDYKVQCIAADLAAGFSGREAARHSRVSPTTVIHKEAERSTYPASRESPRGGTHNRRRHTPRVAAQVRLTPPFVTLYVTPVESFIGLKNFVCRNYP